MADLSELQSASTTKLVGSTSTGIEQTAVQSTGQGALHVNLRNSAGAALEAESTPSLAAPAAVVRHLPYEPPTFLCQASTVVIGNNKSMIAIQNGSSSLVRIQYIKMINNRTAAITGVAADFRLRRITGLSGGTAVAISAHDTSDTLAPSIVASSGGTVAGESVDDLARWVWSSDDWGPGTIDTESSDHVYQQLRYVYKAELGSKPLTLRNGQGVTIKCVTNSTSGEFDFLICFTQE